MKIICYFCRKCLQSNSSGIKYTKFWQTLAAQIPIYVKEQNHKIGRQKIINHDHDKNNSQLPIFCTQSMISGFWKLAEILIDKAEL